jgi:hypothetical protein
VVAHELVRRWHVLLMVSRQYLEDGCATVPYNPTSAAARLAEGVRTLTVPPRDHAIQPAVVGDLADGDMFSLDGQTWHVCGVVLFGTVSVYTGEHDAQDGEPLLVRIDADADQSCLVRRPLTDDRARIDAIAAAYDLVGPTTVEAVPSGTLDGQPITTVRRYTVDRPPYAYDPARRTVVINHLTGGPHATSYPVVVNATTLHLVLRDSACHPESDCTATALHLAAECYPAYVQRVLAYNAEHDTYDEWMDFGEWQRASERHRADLRPSAAG